MTGRGPTPGIDEVRIWDIVNRGWHDMSPSQKQFWEMIRINPERWLTDPNEYRPKMAWVVAIIGQYVIWFNEFWCDNEMNGIDSGFGCSAYQTHGQIGSHFSMLDMPLSDAVQTMLHKAQRT